MDSAEDKPEKSKADKKDDKTPTIRIVIETDPSGSGYTSDGGDGLTSHAGKSDLMDHLSSALPDDESSEETAEADPTSAAPSSSLMDSIKSLTGKK
jgi:hypothetical protein